MKIENTALEIIFIVGSVASCLSLYNPQIECQQNVPSEAKYEVHLTSSPDNDELKASRFLDYAKPKDAALIYDRLLNNESQKKNLNFDRLCRLSNNCAAAMFMLAEQQDQETCITLTRDALQLFKRSRQIAKQLNDTPKYVAASYNEYLAEQALGQENKAESLLAETSKIRIKMTPRVEKGLLP